MSFRAWVFIAALGLLIGQPAYSQEPIEPPDETQVESTPNDQGSEPTTDQDAEPELYNPPSLLPAIQGIEAAIRDLIAEQGRQARQGPDDHEIRDLRAQEKMALWAFWMLFATAVSVVVTAVGVLLIKWTLEATQKAAAYAQDASHAGHRAVDEAERATAAANRAADDNRRIGEAQVRAYPNIDEFRLYIKPESGMVMVQVKIRNLGQSPAKEVVAVTAITIGSLVRYHVVQYPDIPAGGDRYQPVGALSFAKDADVIAAAQLDQYLNVHICCVVFAVDVFDKEITALEHYVSGREVFGEKVITPHIASWRRREGLTDQVALDMLRPIKDRWPKYNED